MSLLRNIKFYLETPGLTSNGSGSAPDPNELVSSLAYIAGHLAKRVGWGSSAQALRRIADVAEQEGLR